MRILTNEEKLKNFPTVRYISLRESVARREFMDAQFARYGIRSEPFIVDRYEDIKDTIKITNEVYVSPLQIGAITSHVRMMHKWYTETDEPYAIFCDDDINFGSIDHWNFTWDEFVTNLPQPWSAVQLIRMDHAVTPDRLQQLGSLELRIGRWWGAVWMMERAYVKWLLKILYNEDGSFNLVSMNGQFMPILENVMFLNYVLTYNFPLFTEANEDHMTTWINKDATDEQLKETEWSYRNRRIYCRIVECFWENLGPDLNIHDALTLR